MVGKLWPCSKPNEPHNKAKWFRTGVYWSLSTVRMCGALRKTAVHVHSSLCVTSSSHEGVWLLERHLVVTLAYPYQTQDLVVNPVVCHQGGASQQQQQQQTPGSTCAPPPAARTPARSAASPPLRWGCTPPPPPPPPVLLGARCADLCGRMISVVSTVESVPRGTGTPAPSLYQRIRKVLTR